MSNNKKRFLIPPEILHHLDLKLNKFFFFGLNGWLLKSRLKMEPILYNPLYFLIRPFLSFYPTLSNLTFGLIKSYFKYVQLKGRSFRYLYGHFSLILKFGFSHKIYYTALNNIYITLLTKRILKVAGRTYQNVSSFFFDLHSIRKFDRYKGKGLLYYKDFLILKPSSKKTKV